jgi:hypothetical protein
MPGVEKECVRNNAANHERIHSTSDAGQYQQLTAEIRIDMTFSNSDSLTNGSYAVEAEFAERVRSNQARLTSALKPQYDFIVCGSCSSGSVVARRLAENPEVSVLLLEAGGDDDVPSVMEANQWPMNLGSERDWSFQGQPNPRVNGRSIPFSMGKVLTSLPSARE